MYKDQNYTLTKNKIILQIVKEIIYSKYSFQKDTRYRYLNKNLIPFVFFFSSQVIREKDMKTNLNKPTNESKFVFVYFCLIT